MQPYIFTYIIRRRTACTSCGRFNKWIGECQSWYWGAYYRAAQEFTTARQHQCAKRWPSTFSRDSSNLVLRSNRKQMQILVSLARSIYEFTPAYHNYFIRCSFIMRAQSLNGKDTTAGSTILLIHSGEEQVSHYNCSLNINSAMKRDRHGPCSRVYIYIFPSIFRYGAAAPGTWSLQWRGVRNRRQRQARPYSHLKYDTIWVFWEWFENTNCTFYLLR